MMTPNLRADCYVSTYLSLAFSSLGYGRVEADELGEGSLELGAGNDGIDEAVGEKVFGGLEIFGEFFADGLLHDAASGKGYCGFGFGEDDIPQHGKASGDASCGGMSQDGNVKQALFAMTIECAGDFGHLHQAQHAFLHSRPAGCTNNNHWNLLLGRPFDQSG